MKVWGYVLFFLWGGGRTVLEIFSVLCTHLKFMVLGGTLWFHSHSKSLTLNWSSLFVGPWLMYDHIFSHSYDSLSKFKCFSLFFTLYNQKDLYQITAAPERYMQLPKLFWGISAFQLCLSLCNLPLQPQDFGRLINVENFQNVWPTARSGDVSKTWRPRIMGFRYIEMLSILQVPWESLLRLSKSKTRLATVQYARRCRETLSTPVQAPNVSSGNWLQTKGYKGQDWNSFSFLRTWERWKWTCNHQLATHPCFL